MNPKEARIGPLGNKNCQYSTCTLKQGHTSCSGARSYRELFSVDLCYARFKQSDWLLKCFQPIRALKTSVA